jgi:hypothetical protein
LNSTLFLCTRSRQSGPLSYAVGRLIQPMIAAALQCFQIGPECEVTPDTRHFHLAGTRNQASPGCAGRTANTIGDMVNMA